MEGFFIDFEVNDLVIESDGSFKTSDISSQNCALIATSQVCRITAPQVGQQLMVKMLNRKNGNVSQDIRNAEKAVRNDGGTNVSIKFNEDNQLTFTAVYDS